MHPLIHIQYILFCPPSWPTSWSASNLHWPIKRAELSQTFPTEWTSHIQGVFQITLAVFRINSRCPAILTWINERLSIHQVCIGIHLFSHLSIFFAKKIIYPAFISSSIHPHAKVWASLSAKWVFTKYSFRRMFKLLHVPQMLFILLLKLNQCNQTVHCCRHCISFS